MRVWVRDTRIGRNLPVSVCRQNYIPVTLKNRSRLLRSRNRTLLSSALFKLVGEKHSLLLENRKLRVMCLSSAEDMAWRARHRCAHYGVSGLQCIQHHRSCVRHCSFEVHQLPGTGNHSPSHHHEPAWNVCLLAALGRLLKRWHISCALRYQLVDGLPEITKDLHNYTNWYWRSNVQSSSFFPQTTVGPAIGRKIGLFRSLISPDWYTWSTCIPNLSQLVVFNAVLYLSRCQKCFDLNWTSVKLCNDFGDVGINRCWLNPPRWFQVSFLETYYQKENNCIIFFLMILHSASWGSHSVHSLLNFTTTHRNAIEVSR